MTAIPDVVGNVLFEFLNSVDAGRYRLGFECSDPGAPGRLVWSDLSQIALKELGGDMGGMLGGSRWIERFSRQRVNRYFKIEEDDDTVVLGGDIERFAQILMSRVRDEAIRACDADLAPGRSLRAMRWRGGREDGEVSLEVAIPDIVDEVLFRLLLAIERGELRLAYKAPLDDEGEEPADAEPWADLAELGRTELNGELAAQVRCAGGWRERFSKERFHHYEELLA